MIYARQAPENALFRLRAFLVLTVMVFSCIPCGWSQDEYQRPMPSMDLPNLYIETMNFSIDSPESTRVDVYLDVPFQALSFTKNENRFTASYEVTMDLDDSAGTLLTERLWSDNVSTRDYGESVSGFSGKMSQKTFYLRPGEYGLNVQVRDSETQKVAHGHRKLSVRKFKRSGLSVSDMMLVDDMTPDGEKTVITPNITNKVTDTPNGIKVYFETYNHSLCDSAMFVLSVLNLRGATIDRDTLRKHVPSGETACFMTVKSGKFNAGDYRIEVFGRTISSTLSTDSTATIAHAFSLRWSGLPQPITDLDNAIDEMQYVSDRETMDKMKKADPAEKRKMFLDFWKQRDPTPGTETNELMEEYYQRVDYSNKNFGHYIPGWKTDRGIVYIIFGVPSNVERHPFEMDSKPYEVWTYYEQNREFVFVDQTGFGDYRLTTPLWDFHNQLR